MEDLSKHREFIEQGTAFLDIRRLSDDIKKSAEQASEITLKLENSNLPESEREKLAEELRQVCISGSEAAQKRLEIMSRYGDMYK